MASSNNNKSVMPDNAWDRGLEMRKSVVGKEYVEASLAKGTSEYTQPMQQYVTEVGWGAFWTRPGLEKKQRSLLSMSAIKQAHKSPRADDTKTLECSSL